MKYIISTLVFLIASALAVGTVYKSRGTFQVIPPKAEVAGSLIHDLGETRESVDTTHTWRITNWGESALVLKLTQTSCGCTASNLKKGGEQLVHPGDAFDATLAIKGNKHGKWSATATLETNDPDHPALTLGFTGKAPDPAPGQASRPDVQLKLEHPVLRQPGQDPAEAGGRTGASGDVLSRTRSPS